MTFAQVQRSVVLLRSMPKPDSSALNVVILGTVTESALCCGVGLEIRTAGFQHCGGFQQAHCV